MKDKELLKEFKNLKINNKLSEQFSEDLWTSLSIKYNKFNGLNSSMENKKREFKFSIFNKQGWLISVLTILIFFLAVALPTYSYYSNPIFKETIDYTLSEVFNVNRKGTLILNTTQEDVEIFIDEESIGFAPLTTELKVGNYRLKAYKKNHSVAYYDLEIKDDKPSQIDLNLIPVSYDDEKEYVGWNVYENTERGSAITYKYPSEWKVNTRELNKSTIETTFTKDEVRIVMYHYLDPEYDKGASDIFANENLINVNYNLNQKVKSISKSLFITGNTPEYDYKIESLSIFWIGEIEPSSEDFNTIFKIVKSCNFMTQYNDGPEYEDGQQENAENIKPTRNYYNYLTKDSTGNIKGYFKSLTNSTPITNYYSDWTPKVNNDSIIVYRSDNDSLMTTTINFSTPDILIESMKTSNISVEFEPISISPNGKKMAMRVTVLDISKCTTDICEFPEELKEGLGWKSGIYVVDLYLNKKHSWYSDETFDIPDPIKSGWTDDSRYLYSIVDSKYLMYFDTEGFNTSKFTLPSGTNYYTGVLMQSTKGGYIQTQSKDQKNTSVKRFRIINEQIVIDSDIITYSNGFEVPTISLSPDGRYLLLGSSTKLFDLQESIVIDLQLKDSKNNNLILRKGLFLTNTTFVGIYSDSNQKTSLIEYDIAARQSTYQFNVQEESVIELN